MNPERFPAQPGFIRATRVRSAVVDRPETVHGALLSGRGVRGRIIRLPFVLGRAVLRTASRGFARHPPARKGIGQIAPEARSERELGIGQQGPLELFAKLTLGQIDADQRDFLATIPKSRIP